MSKPTIQNVNDAYWLDLPAWTVGGCRVPSIMRDDELDYLLDVAYYAPGAGDVVEIGTAWGGSAVAFALANEARGRGERLVTVDPLPYPELEGLVALVSALARLRLRENAHFFLGRSSDLRHWAGRQFRLALVDGAHDVEAVRADVANVAALVQFGGAILMHDVDEAHPGVMAVWEEADGAGVVAGARLRRERIVGSLGLVRVLDSEHVGAGRIG